MSDVRRIDQLASEAGLLLNEAIRELAMPRLLMDLSHSWLSQDPVPMKAIASVRHMVAMSLVMNVYRLRDTRKYFIDGWLLSDKELRTMGFPPIEEFISIQHWPKFETLRNQYAGHVTVQKTVKANQPGKIVSPAVLGKAIRATGLLDLDGFVRRIQQELIPGVEAVRNEIFRRHPSAQEHMLNLMADLEKAIALEDGKGEA